MSQDFDALLAEWEDEYPSQAQRADGTPLLPSANALDGTPSTLPPEFYTPEPPSTAQQIMAPPPQQTQHHMMQHITTQLDQYNQQLPYNQAMQRRILTNMLFHEAISASQSGNRLKAIELLGKTDAIALFAPERQVIEVRNVDELRERITETLTRVIDVECERLE